MRLIEITGFPRSGTTWLFYQLQRLPRVAYFAEEEGLSCWWALRQLAAPYNQAFEDLFRLGGDPTELLKTIVLAGIFAWKHAAVDVVGFLDRLCSAAPDVEHYLHKSPQMLRREGWPHDYVSASRIFDGYTVFCCRRDRDATYESGCRTFPHWRTQFTREKFNDLHETYYQSAAESGWTIVDHADMAADPQAVLDRICDAHFSGLRLQAGPFRRHRPAPWPCLAGLIRDRDSQASATSDPGHAVTDREDDQQHAGGDQVVNETPL